MARKLRLEFPGACYHVINRGNYRTDIFRTEKTKSAFVSCLFEACEKSGWLLHAFVVMRNHYPLALETPDGNLVSGMKWLQVTFANRFNSWRQERGHVFQGRYKALLVEEGDPVGIGVPLHPLESRSGRHPASRPAPGLPALQLPIPVVSGATEIRETQWATVLSSVLHLAGFKHPELQNMPKSAGEKLVVAAFMKMRTQASNDWLCHQLQLGHPRAFSHNPTQYRRHLQAKDPLWHKLASQYAT